MKRECEWPEGCHLEAEWKLGTHVPHRDFCYIHLVVVIWKLLVDGKDKDGAYLMKIVAHENACAIVTQGPVTKVFGPARMRTCTCGGVLIDVHPNTPGLVLNP